ncbi:MULTISPECIES: very short patch repair endonuclease [Methylobacteriaceae]|jgi:DNA mismatch endonuclease (patch repair protein)|uniref:Very short patch repair endonuclease n=2 Tax=Methylobacteriaceae TaxID=119045 RepID=A0AA37HQZ2_9HYPH|nr:MULTISPECIES: very short patch repair endonuclease [Methylobacteriaceae]MDQ0520124.1 DNA mismatch endonuclease (patch repair protein) [Methylobacterium gregans]BAU90587.1 DNA mismatch endonuclease Vsr [Methylorubrum populi]GJD80198.1 Very short patch repair protein [Methylobacterium gregans]GLS52527.1 very short patch repair endonuclease [Methylobacterium gregans]
MRGNKSTDTKPEIFVRQLLRLAGYGYRLHRKDLPGKPDIAFIGRRKAVFVHGCFWHQHKGCKRASKPKSRMDYWRPKLERNQARDAANKKALEARGWSVLTVWECEIKQPATLAAKLQAFMDGKHGGGCHSAVDPNGGDPPQP